MVQSLIKLRFKFTGFQHLLDGIDQFQEFNTNPRVRDTWDTIAEMVYNELVSRAPRGITGDLVSSFVEESGLHQGTPTAIVFSDLLYAPFQERGTDPYWPNIDNLEDWASNHGLTGFQVAAAIAVRGIIARNYAKDTVVYLEDDITQLVGDVVAELLEGTY